MSDKAEGGKKSELGADSNSLRKIQVHMKQVHERARSNAFAHRFAAEHYLKKAAHWFQAQVIFGILGVLAVIFVYVLNSSELFENRFKEIGTVGFTFSSVLFSLLSLYCSIIQNYLGYERLAQLHEHNQHSYLYLCQRAREVTFSEIGTTKAESIREDLERDFQLLKARGKEPSNEHFKAGDKLLEDLKHGKEAKRQSFSEELMAELDRDLGNSDI